MGQVHNLRKEQLERLASDVNNPEIAGFTIKSHGPEAGSGPSNAYLVGIAEHGQNDMAPPITAEDISNFATSRGEALSEDDNYMGGFNDPEITNGRSVSLDVSKAFPRSEGLFKPMMQAEYGGERPENSIGVYDAEGKYEDYIPTMKPVLDPLGQGWLIPKRPQD